ncbi:MAG: HlyD family secretion protein, partial [Planctomycetaceae bacterium]|nr:HlyD family secretion protein [Planctomycetaceae bacterium]
SELLQKRLETLTLPAPIDGVIATWDPQKQLQDRPVGAGTLLLAVIDENGPWRLEVKLPEVDAGPVLAAWQERKEGETVPVEYLLATHPEERYYGSLEEVAIRTENLDEQPMIHLVVVPDPEGMPPLRDGAEVRCKINCGERSLGYVVFRELVEFVHSRLMFLF